MVRAVAVDVIDGLVHGADDTGRNDRAEILGGVVGLGGGPGGFDELAHALIAADFDLAVRRLLQVPIPGRMSGRAAVGRDDDERVAYARRKERYGPRLSALCAPAMEQADAVFVCRPDAARDPAA